MRFIVMCCIWSPLIASIVGCAALGDSPAGDRLRRMSNSSHYDAENETFKNSNPKFKMGSDYFGMLKEQIFGSQIRAPTEPLPEIKPDFDALARESDDIKFIWFGHSTFLVRMGGKSILIDPVFGDYASPVPIFGKRFQKALLQAPEFPHIDVILISHDHYDHLEMETIQHFATTGTQFFVPLGVGAHLESWGVKTEHIKELDWWEQDTAFGLSIICAPAQHFSGRSGFDANSTLWASWIVQAGAKKIYYSGDSGYSGHFKEIGDKHGPFDLTFLENGQYNEKWADVHQMPEQAVAAFFDLKGRKMVPVHWGAYQLSFHDWFDPAERVTAEAARRQVDIMSPKLGELVDLAQPRQSEAWWRHSVDLKK